MLTYDIMRRARQFSKRLRKGRGFTQVIDSEGEHKRKSGHRMIVDLFYSVKCWRITPCARQNHFLQQDMD